MLSNKWYDLLKPVAQYILPALAALYGLLSQIWNLPLAKEISGTIMIADTFLGLLLGISSTQYRIKMKVAQQPALPGMDEQTTPKWYIPKNVYDILYWMAQVFLPAIGSAYFALANLWNFPYPEQIVATIAAIDTFLGVILAISTYELNKSLSNQNTSITQA